MSEIRLIFTVIHLLLVVLGVVNILLIVLIATKHYLRSITNVYMLCLCLADFVYLTALSLVATTALNNRSWPFGQVVCSLYYGAETTAKYASVLFITLLAADRYFAICKSEVARGYRNYHTAIGLSVSAWICGVVFSFPLYYYAETKLYRVNGTEGIVDHYACTVAWPDPHTSVYYIIACSILIYIVPAVIVTFCYTRVYIKLREHIRGSRRLVRQNSSRYRRVTVMVQRVVLFHVICWTPFWVFNLLSIVLGIRASTSFLKIFFNILHLLPYINCAINPFLYAHSAENFRRAFREIVFCPFRRNGMTSGNSALEARSTNCRATNSRLETSNALLNADGRNVIVPVESLSIYVAEAETTHNESGEENKDVWVVSTT
ncbi:unnamed protein product [Auanema sp. JU1783]|nr:unnamed protein product [Auanema sp. JU1783]